MAEAVSFHRARDWPEAERRYRAILQVQPAHPDANHNLGVLAIQVGKPDMALPHLKLALENNPASGQYWLSYADGLLAAGKVQEAQAVAERAIQKGLSGPPVDALLARIRARMGSAPSAVSTLPHPSPPEDPRLVATPIVDKATERKVRALFAQALRHNEAGKLARVESLCREILALDAGHADSWHLIGAIALQSGRLDVAAEMCARAVALKPDHHRAHYNLALALNALGRREEAVRHYERTIALKPDHADALANLGSVLHDLGRIREAIARHEQALAFRPKFPQALYNLGLSFHVLGRQDEAIARYEQAIALRPDYLEALSNLGGVLFGQGRIDKAVACFERALAVRPSMPVILNNLSQAQFAQGRLTEAIGNGLRALRNSGMPVPGLADEALSIERLVRDLPSDTRFTPEQEEYFASLMLYRLNEHGVADWSRLVEPLRRFHWRPLMRFDILVNQAISHWARGDLAGCTILAEADEALGRITHSPGPNFVNNRAYHNYLKLLLQRAPLRAVGSPPEATATIAGDSHSLSYAGSRLAIAGRLNLIECELVMGAKAWHLANDAPNRFKQRFEWVAARAPERSVIICSFGEIDCRLDEGILRFYRRRGGDLGEIVRRQTANYVSYVRERLAPRGQTPLFLGVPAPNLDRSADEAGGATVEDQQLLVEIIRLFNEGLRQVTSSREFVDLYALTNDRNGRSSGRLHIDAYHLVPEALSLALEDR